MDEAALEKIREAKTELARRLKGYAGFAGIGIGMRDGRPVIRVNWRVLPPPEDRLQRLGDIEITHHEVGNIRTQAEE